MQGSNFKTWNDRFEIVKAGRAPTAKFWYDEASTQSFLNIVGDMVRCKLIVQHNAEG